MEVNLKKGGYLELQEYPKGMSINPENVLAFTSEFISNERGYTLNDFIQMLRRYPKLIELQPYFQSWVDWYNEPIGLQDKSPVFRVLKLSRFIGPYDRMYRDLAKGIEVQGILTETTLSLGCISGNRSDISLREYTGI